jgi:hypothetical protein
MDSHQIDSHYAKFSLFGDNGCSYKDVVSVGRMESRLASAVASIALLNPDTFAERIQETVNNGISGYDVTLYDAYSGMSARDYRNKYANQRKTQKVTPQVAGKNTLGTLDLNNDPKHWDVVSGKVIIYLKIGGMKIFFATDTKEQHGMGQFRALTNYGNIIAGERFGWLDYITGAFSFGSISGFDNTEILIEYSMFHEVTEQQVSVSRNEEIVRVENQVVPGVGESLWWAVYENAFYSFFENQCKVSKDEILGEEGFQQYVLPILTGNPSYLYLRNGLDSFREMLMNVTKNKDYAITLHTTLKKYEIDDIIGRYSYYDTLLYPSTTYSVFHYDEVANRVVLRNSQKSVLLDSRSNTPFSDGVFSIALPYLHRITQNICYSKIG